MGLSAIVPGSVVRGRAALSLCCSIHGGKHVVSRALSAVVGRAWCMGEVPCYSWTLTPVLKAMAVGAVLWV